MEADRRSAGHGSEKYRLDQGDFYQLHAYGQNHLDGVGDVVLIYPKTDAFSKALPVFNFRNRQVASVVLPFCLKNKHCCCRLAAVSAHSWPRGHIPRKSPKDSPTNSSGGADATELQAPTPGEFLLYQTEDGRTRVECRFVEDSLWLTQSVDG